MKKQNNVKGNSLKLAALVATLAPIAPGYFCISTEIGGDYFAALGCNNDTNACEVLTSRVWWLDEDGNEVDVDIEELYIDVELINRAVAVALA